MKNLRYIPCIGLLLCLLIGLCACSGKAETPDTMEFKGIPWNASVEEVCQALELEFDPAMWEEESERGGTLRLENWDAFGQTAQLVYFNFANFTDDPTVPPGLCEVHFFYTADCDQQALLDALRAEYGPEAEEYVRYSSIDGESQTWVDNEQLKYWFPKMTLADTLSGAEQSALREAYLSELSDEAAANYIHAEPAGSVLWAENYFDAFSSVIPPEEKPDEIEPWVRVSGTILSLALQLSGA